MAQPASTPCGDERPHDPHTWHGIAQLAGGTKYASRWYCPGVTAATPCAARVERGWHTYPCDKPAKHDVDGELGVRRAIDSAAGRV